jgi:putative membrane protein
VHWYQSYGMGWMGFGLMGIVMVLLFFGSVAGLILLSRRIRSEVPNVSVEAVLAERLAKGEIGEDEYERLRRLVRKR